jgi:hypothetical protein
MALAAGVHALDKRPVARPARGHSLLAGRRSPSSFDQLSRVRPARDGAFGLEAWGR